jgi:glycosyltransferase involved in cell wall biosynthesis
MSADPAIDSEPGQPYHHAVTLSIIVPTRNRAELWRSSWLLDSLRAQTKLADELIIAIDHPDDDTTTAVLDQVHGRPAATRIRVLDVLAPRPGPNPASGIPDNCLFHAATGDIIVHLDDDIHIPTRLLELITTLYLGSPSAVIWPRLDFVDAYHSPLPNVNDCRVDIRRRHSWPTLPGGLVEIPAALQLRWGAAYVARTCDIRAIGGHDLRTCQFHNTDTRLGNRLAAAGIRNYFAPRDELACEHLGPTWHQLHRDDPQATAASQGRLRGPTIANGGDRFWTSTWFDTAYRELDTPNPGPTI